MSGSIYVVSKCTKFNIAKREASFHFDGFYQSNKIKVIEVSGIDPDRNNFEVGEDYLISGQNVSVAGTTLLMTCKKSKKLFE